MNPFRYGSIVGGEYFFDRREECSKIVDTLKGGNNLVLFAPRRYGKTSLVFRAQERLKSEGLLCVYVDLLTVYTLEDFVSVLTRAIFQVQSGWQKRVAQLSQWIKGLRPKLSFDAQGNVSLGLDFAEESISRETLEAVLELPERLASESQRMVLVFDEFQEICRFEKSGLEALMRSKIQKRQYVSYLFLGSRTHLIHSMFNERSRPFYNAALTMQIGKLPREETIVFLVQRFASSGMLLSEDLAALLIDEADAIPYYIQLLAAELWQYVNGGGVLNEESIQFCAEQIVLLKQDFYFEQFDRLSLGQKKLLRAIAVSGENIFSVAYGKRFSLPAVSTLQKALSVLLDQGLVEKSNSVYGIADPFFKKFLNLAFFRS